MKIEIDIPDSLISGLNDITEAFTSTSSNSRTNSKTHSKDMDEAFESFGAILSDVFDKMFDEIKEPEDVPEPDEAEPVDYRFINTQVSTVITRVQQLDVGASETLKELYTEETRLNISALGDLTYATIIDTLIDGQDTPQGEYFWTYIKEKIQ